MGLMWWMLAGKFCGTISHEHPWEVKPGLYYGEHEETETEER